MARQQVAARKPSRSKRDKPAGNGRSAPQGEGESYEQELAGYLQERIRPGLNSGAIPLLARSIAKEIAQRDHPNGTPKDAEGEDEPSAETEDQPSAGGESEDEAGDDTDLDDGAEGDDEPSAESDDDEEYEDDAEADDEEGAEVEAQAVFEDEMHELQADLGEDWILRFSVQGDDAWLTAEKDDGSQRVEAPTAEVLVEAVELLNEAGGRSG
jgi:hypothetical protein